MTLTRFPISETPVNRSSLVKMRLDILISRLGKHRGIAAIACILLVGVLYYPEARGVLSQCRAVRG